MLSRQIRVQHKTRQASTPVPQAQGICRTVGRRGSKAAIFMGQLTFYFNMKYEIEVFRKGQIPALSSEN